MNPEVENIEVIYFIGVGGIGMSALARFFNQKGARVSGYDKTESELTKKLIEEGITIHYVENTKHIPKNVDLVVYTPAIPKENIELKYCIKKSIPIKKRAEVLGMITENMFTIAVAGSHGKTTVSSMIAHILKQSSVDCTAFLGGIPTNYNTNFLMGEGKIAVVEADEFDRSFLELNPDIAIVTAIDSDHLDIYGSGEAVEKSFLEFVGKLKTGGSLIANERLSLDTKVNVSNFISYGLKSKTADCSIENYDTSLGSYKFDIDFSGRKVKEVELNIGGFYNIENALAAVASTKITGVTDEEIKAALANFSGIKRRFEFVIKNGKTTFIDDYAHHPEEIKVLLESVKELFPTKKITAIFQPHLYSRTRDFADGFAKSLSIADEVILLDIYPAREKPIAGVSSNLILENLFCADKSISRKKELNSLLIKKQPELLLTIGAGNIGELVEGIKQLILNNYEENLA